MLITKLFNQPKKILHNADVIINWNPLKRCILMLILCSGLNLLWITWKIYILLTPDVQPFVNMELLKYQFFVNCLFLLIFLALIYPCYKLQDSNTAQKIMPFICVSFFAFNLCLDGYLVGLLSPVTAIVIVGVTAVGLLLFNRKVVYFALIPSLFIMIYVMYQTIEGRIQYAPLFRFEGLGKRAITNSFWVGSMFFFMCVIALGCLILFDLMIKQWQRREQSFKLLSQIDPLTGIFNRRSINQCLMDISHHMDESQKHGIILLDLDHFKRINDSYGHLKGDEVLVHVSDALQHNVRKCDIVGRYGGEEFILIIKNTTLIRTQQIAERCQLALIDLDVCDEQQQHITIRASFGIAFLQQDCSVQHTLHLADVAMYQAKEAGRNCIRMIEHDTLS